MIQVRHSNHDHCSAFRRPVRRWLGAILALAVLLSPFETFGGEWRQTTSQGVGLTEESHDIEPLVVSAALFECDQPDDLNALRLTDFEESAPLVELLPTELVFEDEFQVIEQTSAFRVIPDSPFEPVWPSAEQREELDWSQFSDDRGPFGFFAHDLGVAMHNLDDDFKGLWEPRNILFLGTGLGISLALRDEVDQDTRAYVARSPKRWGKATETLGIMGNTEVQVAGILLLYSYGYSTEDDELLDFTRLLIRNYAMTGLATVGLKAVTNTDRPSSQWTGGQFGFPSAHVSTSFAIAATIEEYYGPQWGIPAYILAGAIGWSRIDERDHDVSDVVFGAFLGYAIAKSISGRELRDDSRIQFFPWMNPGDGSLGGMLELTY